MNISADLFDKEDESFTNTTLRLLHGHLIASSAYLLLLTCNPNGAEKPSHSGASPPSMIQKN
ncbi:hypothetical protein EYF80_030905 [Liparis tanakae]|uniref:Uncharacterized protein n=1 Tax=Liparis tanakae TaxID=230148 RepID=A0A4Z2H0M5_9TELE|nr:hypothetical protein EYF80_030905 [Liparis tanakae]